MRDSVCKKITAFCISATLAVTSLPVLMTGAADAPCLKIQTVSLVPENIPEDRIITVDVSVSDNTSGFMAASFGIQYDNALIYQSCTAVSAEGRAFEVASNPDKNLLWFMAAGSMPDDWKNQAAEDTLFQLTFEVPPEVEGGTFPITFVWQGQDGSSAFWYQDKQNNLIEEIQNTAVNGSVDIHGGGEINHASLRMNQDTQEQLVIYNAATQVIWFSSDPSVASVDENGLVTAVGAGECDVQAFLDNELQACHVVVTADDIYSVQGTEDLVLINPVRGVVLEYPNAVGTVTWTSASPSVIQVDADGRLHFMQEGTDCSARIFGTNSGKTYMKNVIVKYISETESDTEDISSIETESFSEPTETEILTEPTETEILTESTETEILTEPTETEILTESTETEILTESTESETEPQIIRGDLDENGKVNILDVIIINRNILGKEQLNPQQKIAADFDGNGKIESNDSLAIMKKIVGLE